MLRRRAVLSLLVAMFALAGASAPPTRGLAGTHETAIVWQTRDARRVQVARSLARRIPASPANVSQLSASAAVDPTATVVRHALFQRPPPEI